MTDADTTEIAGLTIAELADALSAGRWDSVQVFEAYKARIIGFEAELNAFTHLRFDAARREAEASAARWRAGAPLSPLDGAIIGVKANIAVAGLPRHAGIGAYGEAIAENDAAVVAQLKQVGAVIIGALNMHEGALGATTDNPWFGRTENPWRHGVTPGGSSGGSGAAVAAGLVCAALGTDTMGSVRIPSAYCGCVGHKPTAGLVSNEGVLALSPTLDHVGLHVRSILDAFIVLNGMSGGRAPMTPRIDGPELKLGLWTGEEDIDVAPEMHKAVTDVAKVLRDYGAEVEPITPPLYAYGADRRQGLLISEREGAAIHAEELNANPEGFSQSFRDLLAWGAGRDESDYQKALARVAALREAAHEVFRNVHAILAPTAPQTAFAFEDDVPINQADFTAWANFAGLPATTIPVGVSSQGLPLAVQLIGPAGEDSSVLAGMGAIENVLPAMPHPPRFFAGS